MCIANFCKVLNSLNCESLSALSVVSLLLSSLLVTAEPAPSTTRFTAAVVELTSSFPAFAGAEDAGDGAAVFKTSGATGPELLLRLMSPSWLLSAADPPSEGKPCIDNLLARRFSA